MSEEARNAAGPLGAVLIAAAIAAAAIPLAMPAQTQTFETFVTGAVITTSVLASFVIQSIQTPDRRWIGARSLAGNLLLMGIAVLVFLVANLVSVEASGPRLVDLAFLAPLVPLIQYQRAEFRAHFADADRNDIADDTLVIGLSVTAISYFLLLPSDADVITSISAACFAVVASVQLSGLAPLALWAPSAPHLLQLAVFIVYGAATLLFGWEWVGGSTTTADSFVYWAYALCPLALAGVVIVLCTRHQRGDEPTQVVGRVRPVLTSVAVIAAFGALAAVAVMAQTRETDPIQVGVIVALLGVGIAGRIVAQQVRSMQAQQEVREALAERESALGDADAALEQVRQANETLQRSEEHLRMVFDTAVDGIVELDQRDRILAANEAFTRMIGLDREAIEGQPWGALAASVQGADDSFRHLPTAGQAQVARVDGQPIHLEARVSSIPTDPPRRLLLVRDVTSAKVADQTIRSLFKFLQDRDEDRTRLLRRTNATIEAERNRIARDLHDGPVQGVSAASLSLEAALLMIRSGDVEGGIEVLLKIRQDLAEEADALRQLMSGLRPPVLEERGLFPALRDALTKFQEERDVRTRLTGSIDRSIPDDLETLAFRVVQEALSNAAKHADAQNLSVHVEADEEQLRIEIVDDGQGFDSARSREFLRQGRVGLASMRERVELASGTFIVRSSPGRGTAIVATLPLESLSSREPATSDR
jgi:PAS domain S-box-containing protein